MSRRVLTLDPSGLLCNLTSQWSRFDVISWLVSPVRCHFPVTISRNYTAYACINKNFGKSGCKVFMI